MVDEADRALKSGGSAKRLDAVVNKYANKFQRGGFIERALPSEVGQLVQHVERYAKAGGGLGTVFSEFLTALGPVGSLIRTLAVKPSREADIEAATQLLQMAGYTVTPPKGKAKEPAGIEAVLGYLEQLGFFNVVEPEKPKAPELPFGIPEKTKGGGKRQTIDVPGGYGVGTMRFRTDDPAVTGEAIEPKSANVYSYQYDMDAATLYVRFKAKTAKGAPAIAPGSLYAYYDVTPLEFKRFHRKAGTSAGEAVWDYLRVRGSAFEHQKDYRLVGIMPAFVGGRLYKGYVPRKATYFQGQPVWKRREQVYLGQGQWTRSQLGSEAIPLWADRGEPNRGEPNRG